MAARLVLLLQLAAITIALLLGGSRAAYCKGSLSRAPLLDRTPLKGSSAMIHVLNSALLPGTLARLTGRRHTCAVHDDSRDASSFDEIPYSRGREADQPDASCVVCRLDFTFGLMNGIRRVKFTPRLPKYGDGNGHPLPFLRALQREIPPLDDFIQVSYLNLERGADMYEFFQAIKTVRRESHRRFASGGIIVIDVHGASRDMIQPRRSTELPSTIEYFSSSLKYRLKGVISREYSRDRPEGMYVATVLTVSPFLYLDMWRQISFSRTDLAYATQELYYTNSPFKILRGHVIKMLFYVRV